MTGPEELCVLRDRGPGSRNTVPRCAWSRRGAARLRLARAVHKEDLSVAVKGMWTPVGFPDSTFLPSSRIFFAVGLMDFS